MLPFSERLTGPGPKAGANVLTNGFGLSEKTTPLAAIPVCVMEFTPIPPAIDVTVGVAMLMTAVISKRIAQPNYPT